MTIHTPFLDLSVAVEERRELLSAIEAVFAHGRLINGPEVARLESSVAEYCGRAYATSVNSGSSALYLAIRALGLDPGDEVITSSFSWVATANAITLNGGVPVFADTDQSMNVPLEKVVERVTDKTRGILLVDYAGQLPRDILKIADFARDNGLWLIEDASQAFGATLDDITAGSVGDLSCISMNSMKILASVGEAGMVVTNDRQLSEKIAMLRNNGMHDNDCLTPGINGRMPTIQAAVLLKRLEKVGQVIRRRREIADIYSESLSQAIGRPMTEPGAGHVFYRYCITTPLRDRLAEYLVGRGIETKVAPDFLPALSNYKSLEGGFIKSAANMNNELLAIPCHQDMSDEQVYEIVAAINDFIDNLDLES